MLRNPRGGLVAVGYCLQQRRVRLRVEETVLARFGEFLDIV